jgi:hypothetical protein
MQRRKNGQSTTETVPRCPGEPSSTSPSRRGPARPRGSDVAQDLGLATSQALPGPALTKAGCLPPHSTFRRRAADGRGSDERSRGGRQWIVHRDPGCPPRFGRPARSPAAREPWPTGRQRRDPAWPRAVRHRGHEVGLFKDRLIYLPGAVSFGRYAELSQERLRAWGDGFGFAHQCRHARAAGLPREVRFRGRGVEYHLGHRTATDVGRAPEEHLSRPTPIRRRRRSATDRPSLLQRAYASRSSAPRSTSCPWYPLEVRLEVSGERPLPGSRTTDIPRFLRLTTVRDG